MNVNMNRIETLEELIESYKKCPYKVETYEFDGTGYALLIIEINKMLKENKKYKEVIEEFMNYIEDNKLVLNNPAIFDFYLKIKEVE